MYISIYLHIHKGQLRMLFDLCTIVIGLFGVGSRMLKNDNKRKTMWFTSEGPAYR